MSRFINSLRITAVAGCALVAILLFPSAAAAYEFDRPLSSGLSGKDVRALQVRIAGWYPTDEQEQFLIDGSFGGRTEAALRAFQEHYGLKVNGVANNDDFQLLNSMQDPNNTTAHFDWSEFVQNESQACSAKANAYAGTFDGGMVPPKKVKRNVRRLMWRLEAIRAKGGNQPVGINSGFRSVAYNDCIGGAGASQHLYGDAADNRMTAVTNRKERSLARSSQVHGIACYKNQSHNHFDLRLENKKSPSTQFWWWPKRDEQGRDLTDGGEPCWGEVATAARSSSTTQLVLKAVAAAVPGAGSLVPSAEEVSAFQRAGEAGDLAGTD